MILGFFRADHSRLHQPTHIGVVAGYPRNLAVADEVETRVADMHVIERIVALAAVLTVVRRPERTPDNRRRRAGGSHAPQFRMGKAILPDLLVGRLQSLNQRRLRIVAAKVAIDLHQCFHRQTARFLTAFVAAHAVRHNRQTTLAQELPVALRLPITKGILVVLAQAADVGLARYFNSGANLHPVTTSSAGMTSIGNDSIRGHARTSRL